MTDEPPDAFEPASTHLEAALAPRKGTPLAKALRTVATIAAGLLTNDLESGPSAIDLVVIRRATGGEVLRVSAGTAAEADRLLFRVRRDLDVQTVSEFVSAWRPPDPSLGPESDPEPASDAEPDADPDVTSSRG
ncbi:MAG: hypothetical protein ABWY55_12775 [Microbacterium sp.]